MQPINQEEPMTQLIDSAIAIAFIASCLVFMMGLESLTMWLVR